MRTTLDLPDSLFREVKTRAIQKGLTLKALVAQYIEAGLRGPISPSDAALKRPRSPFPIPIARRADGTATSALSNAQLNAILEEEDFARYDIVVNQSK